MSDHRCEVEGCLCQTTTQPITEAVYGKKPKRRPQKEEHYAPHEGTEPLWQRISDDEMSLLARVFPKARRFAARRK
jgi:hypothetical protein